MKDQDQLARLLEMWKRSREEAVNEIETISGKFMNRVSIPDSPAYPLARSVHMPDGHAYKIGAVSFRLKDLVLAGVDASLNETGVYQEEGDRIKLKLVMDRLQLAGRCSLEVKPDPVLTMDTAGNLMDLTEESCRPLAAGADGNEDPADPQVEQWLDQARDQRKRLMDTDNGIKLIDMYNEHNEVYEQVFRESSAMKTTWQAGGVTREMSADTSDAINSNADINNKTYKRTDTGETVHYNSHAFTQQLAIALNTALTDPKYDPFEPDSVPQGKYLEASKAALSFGMAVKSTGNDKKNVNLLKPEEVYATVDTHEGTMPVVKDEAVSDLLQQGAGPGGGSADGNLGWTVLDEEDRTLLRNLFEANLKERAEKAAFTGTPLFEGNCEAFIGRVEAEVTLSIGLTAQGSEALIQSVAIDVPAFALDIDDSHWHGDVGKVAAERLEGMYFIRSLLHNSIVDRLQAVLRDKVKTVCSHAAV